MVLEGGKRRFTSRVSKRARLYNILIMTLLVHDLFRCFESCPMVHYMARTHLILMTTADIRLPIRLAEVI
jgi:hypothetical protein